MGPSQTSETQRSSTSSRLSRYTPGAYGVVPDGSVIVTVEEDEELSPQPELLTASPLEAHCVLMNDTDHGGAGDITLGAEKIFDADVQVEKDYGFCAGKRLWLMIGAVVLVVVVVVVVVPIVVVVGADSENPTLVQRGTLVPTTPAPTGPLAPTSAPVSISELCYNSVSSLTDAFLSVQLDRRDNGYPFLDLKLCENTTCTVLSSKSTSLGLVGTMPPLLTPSNTRIKCGEDGSAANGCVVDGRYYLALNILPKWEVLFFTQEIPRNVTFEGITFLFSDPWTSIMMANGGEITFRNCIFQVNVPECKRDEAPDTNAHCSTVASLGFS